MKARPILYPPMVPIFVGWWKLASDYLAGTAGQCGDTYCEGRPKLPPKASDSNLNKTCSRRSARSHPHAPSCFRSCIPACGARSTPRTCPLCPLLPFISFDSIGLRKTLTDTGVYRHPSPLFSLHLASPPSLLPVYLSLSPFMGPTPSPSPLL